MAHALDTNHSKVVIETWNLSPDISDHFGQSQNSSAFRVYGEKFTEKFIKEKCDFWYSQWDAIASESPEALGMTIDERNAEWERTYRMLQAWSNRLANYTIYDY